MAVTLDPNLAGIFKIWYTDKSPEDVFFRNDPLVKMIPKTRIGGKQYNVPLLLGNGGNASGNLLTSTSQAQASGSAPNVEFAVTNGQIFATFFITNQEILASKVSRGAYMPVAVNRLAQGLDSFRKLAATSLYGSGFGEIGNAVVATTIVGANTVDFLKRSIAVKLSVGSIFRVTNGATPVSALRTSVNTVTKINGTKVTFTATAVETWAATDWIELEGCRNGNTPLLPIGLGGKSGGWLPIIADRTGATWDTYIGTSFFGVDRSVNVEGAAGQYIKRDTAGSEKKVDAIVRGVQAVRTAGGVPDLLVINSTDYSGVIGEISSQTTFFQSIGTGKAKEKNEVAKGIQDMSFAFSTSWVQQVIDTPFCPEGTAYILEKDMLEFAGLTNSEAPLNDGINGNDPGKQDLTSFKAPEMNYYWLIEDYITSQPGGNTMNGPALQVIVQMYGSWVVHNPSKACIIDLI